MANNKLFQVARSLDPGRSNFDLSFSMLFTADFGFVYPVMCEEVLPGDRWNIGYQAYLRAMPMLAPMLSRVDICVYSFFDANRVMFEGWEDFITGGEDGTDATVLPVWNPTITTVGSLWDFLIGSPGAVPGDGDPSVLDFPRITYNRIWNNYFRDQNLIDPVALTNETILKASWQKDYFASALPFQQRGVAPAFPISGIISTQAVFEAAGSPIFDTYTHESGNVRPLTVDSLGGAPGTPMSVEYGGAGTLSAGGRDFGPRDTELTAANTVDVDLSNAITFTVPDLRLGIVLQHYMELTAQAGVRYVEWLEAFYSIKPQDSRLQRPEYIGGGKFPLIVSEVLQTSETATTPQGNLAGHGISVDTSFLGSYFAQEHGWITTVFVIKPKPAYMQGINRQLTRRTRFDYINPLFVHLSEQAILQKEIFVSGDANDGDIFGYQGYGDEYRVKYDRVAGLMRTDFDYWHLARKFDTAPVLGQDFVEIDSADDDLKRIFAVPTEPGFVVNFGNRVTASRPLPFLPIPGVERV